MRQGDRITGVELDNGEVSANIVVNAAGPWAKPLAESAGLALPLRSVREQDTVWQVPAGRAVPKCSISMGVDACYYRPLGQGRFIIGRGFPKEYFDVDPYNYKVTADDAFIADVQTRVERRFPAFAGMKLIEAYAALYDVTPDWYPFVGPRAGIAGYADFCGGSGHGFKIAPAIGRELADWLLDRQSGRRFPPVQPRPHRGGQPVRAILRRQGSRHERTRGSFDGLLEVSLRQRFGGVDGARWRGPRRRGGAHHRPDRPERRRQDHAVQRRHRRAAAERRHGHLSPAPT